NERRLPGRWPIEGQADQRDSDHRDEARRGHVGPEAKSTWAHGTELLADVRRVVIDTHVPSSARAEHHYRHEDDAEGETTHDGGTDQLQPSQTRLLAADYGSEEYRGSRGAMSAASSTSRMTCANWSGKSKLALW